MRSHLRLSALAVVLLAGTVVGCAGPQSASTGATPTQTAAAPGYMVPPGYVSGVRILPYNGRIQSKCDHLTNPDQRATCISSER